MYSYLSYVYRVGYKHKERDRYTDRKLEKNIGACPFIRELRVVNLPLVLTLILSKCQNKWQTFFKF